MRHLAVPVVLAFGLIGCGAAIVSAGPPPADKAEVEDANPSKEGILSPAAPFDSSRQLAGQQVASTLARPGLTPDSSVSSPTPAKPAGGSLSLHPLPSRSEKKKTPPIADAKIPEPASILLLISGAIGLIARRKLSKNRLEEAN